MKPITVLIRCQHIWIEGEPMNESYGCDLDLHLGGSETCTTQDYLICPLKGRDDKDIRTGKRTV